MCRQQKEHLMGTNAKENKTAVKEDLLCLLDDLKENVDAITDCMTPTTTGIKITLRGFGKKDEFPIWKVSYTNVSKNYIELYKIKGNK